MQKEQGQKNKKEDNLGITVKKSEDFSEWFTQVVVKSELADYSAVSGCMVLRPLGYELWEKIVKLTDERIKKLGVKNCYFPLFIPESLLQKEKEHVEGFSPEVAWVTHAGDTKLNERLAIRPTSEVIMYDSYSKWIRSWRDLPLKLNQWNNVVRWEFKHPTLLLRTREFWWNEGHTAFATLEEADEEIKQIMEIWREILNDYLALFSVAGKKSEKEKFAGALATYAHECFLNGRFAQGPDAHSDGQNFAKAYNIKFLDKEGAEEYVYQNTWAITTRMLGVLVGVHGDDKGLVLPPKMATNKVVIVPILFKDTKDKVLRKAKELVHELSAFDALLDKREEYSTGYKFNYWELKGIPLRIEIGPKDIENSQVVVVRRDNFHKEVVKFIDLKRRINIILDEMQKEMHHKSKKLFEDGVVKVKTFKDFKDAIKNKKGVIAPFCNEPKCEDFIKDESGGASSRVMISEHSSEKCIKCGKSAKCIMYFGKSY